MPMLNSIFLFHFCTPMGKIAPAGRRKPASSRRPENYRLDPSQAYTPLGDSETSIARELKEENGRWLQLLVSLVGLGSVDQKIPMLLKNLLFIKSFDCCDRHYFCRHITPPSVQQQKLIVYVSADECMNGFPGLFSAIFCLPGVFWNKEDERFRTKRPHGNCSLEIHSVFKKVSFYNIIAVFRAKRSTIDVKLKMHEFK